MEDKSIPYFAHEGMMVRMERTNHRLWILSIVLIVCLIVSNLAWMLDESQFEYYDETYQQVTQEAESGDGDAINRFTGGDYGEGNTDSNND